MVKKFIIDPLEDEAGVSMRYLRANRAYKYISKRRTKKINEEKLDSEKLDPYFNNLFTQLDENVKQELVWLWSELGSIQDELQKYENLENVINLDTNNHTPPSPPAESPSSKKRKPSIFGP